MLNGREWASIQNMVELETGRLIGRRRDYFFVSTVVRRDPVNNVLWVKEPPDMPGSVTGLALQPIPFYAFDYEVIYYDTVGSGTPYFSKNTVYRKYAKVRPLLPQVGEQVLLVREFGTNRLPRCLGVLRSRNFILDEDEDG